MVRFLFGCILGVRFYWFDCFFVFVFSRGVDCLLVRFLVGSIWLVRFCSCLGGRFFLLVRFFVWFDFVGFDLIGSILYTINVPLGGRAELRVTLSPCLAMTSNYTPGLCAMRSVL